MKFFSKSILVLLAAFVCLGWAESWETIQNNAGNISSIQADFIQEKHLKILRTPLLSRGVFVFQAPDSLRWQYESPVQSLLLLHEGKTRQFIQHDNRLVEERSMGMDAMQVVSQEISRWLAGNFTDNPTFQARLKAGGFIVLTPKNKGLAQLISQIVLKLADEPGLMESVTIYEGSDSFTKLTFTNVVLNKKIPETTFTQQ